MAGWVLGVSAAIALGVAAVYGYVAYRLVRRPVSAEARLASAQFSLWWGGLGTLSAITGLEAILAGAGVLTLAAAYAAQLLVVLVTCLLLWALIGYLVYVYYGRYHLAYVSGFYAVFYLAALYYTVLTNPYGFVVRHGVVTLLTSPVTATPLTVFIVLGLIVPEFVCAGLYLSLLRRTHDRSQRFRITVVGVSIVAWFAIDLFFPTSSVPLVLARSVLLLAPAVATLLAYLPPAWVRSRYGIEGVESAPAPVAGPPSTGS